MRTPPHLDQRLEAYFASLRASLRERLKRSPANWQIYAAVSSSAMAMMTSAAAAQLGSGVPILLRKAPQASRQPERSPAQRRSLSGTRSGLPLSSRLRLKPRVRRFRQAAWFPFVARLTLSSRANGFRFTGATWPLKLSCGKAIFPHPLAGPPWRSMESSLISCMSVPG
jgi:hypothetical protein